MVEALSDYVMSDTNLWDRNFPHAEILVFHETEFL
jgi:hypothetical protein